MKQKKLKEFSELEELRKAYSTLQRQHMRAKKKVEDLVQAVERGAYDAALAAGPYPKVPMPKYRQGKRGGEEVCLVHATDWQVGKRTRSYNTEIAEQRLAETFLSKICLLTDIQRSDHPVKNCALLLGGDMVEGVQIFPGQAFEVDSTLYDQLFSAVRIGYKLIRGLLQHFEAVEIWSEFGNHGRLGKRGDYPGRDNMDSVMYRILRDRFETEPRCTWHLNEHDFYNRVTIGKYIALLVHGDEIKQFGGNTPAFGIARKVTAWASGVIEPFHDAYMGHWHQALVVPLPVGNRRIFLTPSSESDNDYASEFCAAKGVPGQRVHFIDPEKGRVTCEYVVWL